MFQLNVIVICLPARCRSFKQFTPANFSKCQLTQRLFVAESKYRYSIFLIIDSVFKPEESPPREFGFDSRQAKIYAKKK